MRRPPKEAAPFLMATLLGALFSTGFEPYGWSWAALTALPLQILLAAYSPLSAGRAAARQFAFGLGLFVPGLFWTTHSMTAHGHVPFPLALSGLLLLAALCALFSGAAMWLAARSSRPGLGRALAFAGLWCAAEWVRGPGLVHFGWLTPAELAPDLPVAGWMPLLGSAGVNLALLLSAVFGAHLAATLRSQGRAREVVTAFLLVGILFGGGELLRRIDWSEPYGTLSVRILQSDLPIANAFVRVDPEERVRAVAAGVRPWPADAAAARLTVTPEGMLTVPTDRLGSKTAAALADLLRASDGPLLWNGFRPTPSGYANTAFLSDASGLAAHTDKRRLVPFGEYVPAGFRWFVDLLGIPLTDLTEGDFGQRPWRPYGAEAPSVGVLICYENVDGAVLRSWRGGLPNILVVTANLGWFSESAVPQHRAMSRLRAIEAARPLVSVNNTGLSSVIDPHGRILSELAPEGRDAAFVRVTGARGLATPALTFGEWPALGFALLLWGLAFSHTKRRTWRFRN